MVLSLEKKKKDGVEEEWKVFEEISQGQLWSHALLQQMSILISYLEFR